MSCVFIACCHSVNGYQGTTTSALTHSTYSESWSHFGGHWSMGTRWLNGPLGNRNRAHLYHSVVIYSWIEGLRRSKVNTMLSEEFLFTVESSCLIQLFKVSAVLSLHLQSSSENVETLHPQIHYVVENIQLSPSTSTLTSLFRCPSPSLVPATEASSPSMRYPRLLPTKLL